MRMRLSARTNRLHVQNLLPFRLYVISLDAQSTIRGEVSQSHEGKPPFWSGNLVGASPYAAAVFEYFSQRVSVTLTHIA